MVGRVTFVLGQLAFSIHYDTPNCDENGGSDRASLFNQISEGSLDALRGPPLTMTELPPWPIRRSYLHKCSKDTLTCISFFFVFCTRIIRQGPVREPPSEQKGGRLPSTSTSSGHSSLSLSLSLLLARESADIKKQRMLGTQFHVRTVSSFKALTDRWNATSSSSCCSTIAPHFSVGLGWCKCTRCRFGPKAKPILISCKSSRCGGSSGGRSNDLHDDDPDHHDYLRASLLISETLKHHRIWRQGFSAEMRFQAKGSRQPPDMSLIRHDEFLRRFDSPTIFLKISCGGDFLLPVIAGGFAIETLVDSLKGVNDGDCPDQFLLVKNIVEALGYEVKMVRITGVSGMYFARLYFTRQRENGALSVVVQPSDAINIAHRFKAPIYVNKQIVLTDAIKISYGRGRGRGSKPTYDVSLDSAADGPDIVMQELNLMRNMNLAVKEERYKDAVMWRDKIIELRKPRHDC